MKTMKRQAVAIAVAVAMGTFANQEIFAHYYGQGTGASDPVWGTSAGAQSGFTGTWDGTFATPSSSEGLYGGYSSGNATVQNNKVTVNAGNFVLYGAGFCAGYSSEGKVQNNELTLNQGVVISSGDAAAGQSNSGLVDNNILTLNGVSASSDRLMGGKSQTGSVTNNKVYIHSGSSQHVFGGFAKKEAPAPGGILTGDATSGDVIGNAVILDGNFTFSGGIGLYGGYSEAKTSTNTGYIATSGDVIGNTVVLNTDAAFNSRVICAYTHAIGDTGTTSGDVKYNALIWFKGKASTSSDFTIQGGVSEKTVGAASAIRNDDATYQGNLLAVVGSVAQAGSSTSYKTVNSIKDFQDYFFVLDDTVKIQNVDKSALTADAATGDVMLSIQTTTAEYKKPKLEATDRVAVALSEGIDVSQLQVGSKTILMNIDPDSSTEYKVVKASKIIKDLGKNGNTFAAQTLTQAVGKVNLYDFDVDTTTIGSETYLYAEFLEMSPSVVVTDVRQIADSNYVNFRSQINDVTLRMGELRTSNKDGGWARVYGGEYKLGSGMKEKSVTVQVGADKWFSPNSYVGVTGSYTKADDTLTQGSNDQKNWNVGFYGGYVAESGLFVDAIVKYGQLKNDFSLTYEDGEVSKGKYHTTGTSASIEGGWRYTCPNTGFYAEPQLELMYGHLQGVTFNAGEVEFKNDAVNTLVGRFGVSTGYKFAENKGNAYVKASVLRDFKGKVKTLATAESETDGGSTRDLGGTWGEFVLGGNFKATDSLSVYGEAMCATKAAGVQTKWQGSVGVRYTF